MWWHTRRIQISSFVRNGRVHLNRAWGVSSVDCWQSRCAPSAVVMLDKPCSEVVWRVLATHFIRQIPLHFPPFVSPCAITFQLLGPPVAVTLLNLVPQCGREKLVCVITLCNKSLLTAQQTAYVYVPKRYQSCSQTMALSPNQIKNNNNSCFFIATHNRFLAYL